MVYAAGYNTIGLSPQSIHFGALEPDRRSAAASSIGERRSSWSRIWVEFDTRAIIQAITAYVDSNDLGREAVLLLAQPTFGPSREIGGAFVLETRFF